MAKYKFKGYTISCCGYHQPDHCVWWEAVDDSGCACFHGNTLREVEFMIIDSEWEDKLRKKDNEIAELRECLRMAVVNIRIARTCCAFGRECDNCGQSCDARKWNKVIEATKGAEDDK